MVTNGRLQPLLEQATMTDATLEQIAEKIIAALQLEYAEVKLVIKRGKLRFIEGPTPSEAVKR